MNKEWTSKEGAESSYIKISNRDAIRVVEIEYTDALESLKKTYKSSKDIKEKKEIRQTYVNKAIELNRQFKRDIYLEKI